MSSEKILVGHDELGRFIRDVLVAKGARAEDAAVVAEGLVWANLRGGDGHGVSRLPRYLKLIDNGEIDMKIKPRLLQDRGASFVLDCGHGFGPVAVMRRRRSRSSGPSKPASASAWCAKPPIPAPSAAMRNGSPSGVLPPC